MYKNHNKTVAFFLLLLCSNLVFCVDEPSEDNSIKSKKKNWVDSALLIGVAPLTAVFYGMIGTSVASPLLLFMDSKTLFNTGIPFILYLGGFAYGSYEGYCDIQNGELSSYSNMASSIYVSLMAIGKLLA